MESRPGGQKVQVQVYALERSGELRRSGDRPTVNHNLASNFKFLADMSQI
jgi:hypothetical protein